MIVSIWTLTLPHNFLYTASINFPTDPGKVRLLAPEWEAHSTGPSFQSYHMILQNLL
jgi:hypothetical protein